MNNNGPTKILIVEDERLTAKLAAKTLQHPRRSIIHVDDAEQALSMFEQIKPHVIILDLTLPGMSGLQFLEKLKPSLDSPYAVIVVTGMDDPESIRQIFAKGARSYIRKPFIPEELRQKVDIIVNHLELQARNQRNIQQLRTSEKRFRLIAETIEQVFWMNSPSVDEMIYASPAYERIWGRSLESLYQSPKSFIDAIHPEDKPQVVEHLKEHGQGRWSCEYRIVKPDGSIRHIHDQGHPVLNDQGVLTMMVGAAEDVTSLKQTENQLRKTLKQKDTVLAELHHRIKNNLATIAGLMEIEAMKTTSGKVRRAFNSHAERIRSISLVHELLYSAEDMTQIPLDSYVRGLIRNLVDFHDCRNLKLQLKLQNIDLPIDSAIPCGMIIHEAVTNAFQHAFKSQQTKNLNISAKQNQGDIQINIQDNGPGFQNPQKPAQPKSMGVELMKGLAKELNGQIHIENYSDQQNSGARITLSFPIKLKSTTNNQPKEEPKP